MKGNKQNPGLIPLTLNYIYKKQTHQNENQTEIKFNFQKFITKHQQIYQIQKNKIQKSVELQKAYLPKIQPKIQSLVQKKPKTFIIWENLTENLAKQIKMYNQVDPMQFSEQIWKQETLKILLKSFIRLQTQQIQLDQKIQVDVKQIKILKVKTRVQIQINHYSHYQM
ncbi:hypothetical protein IMG5_126410 [Ichthyophthirius multifiliis]|uniref:Uncharacterized protein n=1 Tax=Ichthyophthirius multifiliis TaxID=5932 RepID=G0QVT8_ICHMU|nr:hypothetical protein IMG5_126410 [Ichthyophthirius multifiliis]EGR30660.1 hypothetical protein IMG5_126410 [Ichthyophthirius multifiliis]|eukprot:XP_004032247.1 hypothetical protein IMG5_126410 [Ichthyophthirius multifiliis]